LNTLGSNQKMSGKRKEKEKGRKEGKIFLKLKEEEERKRKKEEKRRKEMEMEKEERVSERKKEELWKIFRSRFLPSFLSFPFSFAFQPLVNHTTATMARKFFITIPKILLLMSNC